MQSIANHTHHLRRAGRVALGAAALAVTAAALAPLFASVVGLQGERRTLARPAALLEDAATGVSVAPAWIELPGAARRFVLADNHFGREPDFHAARRHSAGGGRLDQMAFGSAAQPRPFLLLSIYRPLDEPFGAASFWLEMARRAGESGLALERAPPVPDIVPTRLGPFELGVLKTKGDQAAGAPGPRECLGFRHQSQQSVLVISGLACMGATSADEMFARAALVCALEAITLAGGDEDPDLAAFFRGSHAPSCPANGPKQAGG